MILSAVSILVAMLAIGGCDAEGAAGAPVAPDDGAATDRDTPVSLSLIANDVAFAPAALDSASADLDPATPGAQQHITTDAGDYLLDCLGDVRFVPTSAFAGDATAEYTIADNEGRVSAPALITITVRD